MTGTYQVETSLLHLAHLAYFGSIKGHSTQHTIVVMHAGTTYEHLLAVEHETILSIERERADTIFSRMLLATKLHTCLIQIWRLGRPKLGIINSIGKTNCRILTGFQRNLVPFTFHFNGALLGSVALVLYRYLYLHRSLVHRNIRCGNKHTIFGNV